jgi:hypothetical protein
MSGCTVLLVDCTSGCTVLLVDCMSSCTVLLVDTNFFSCKIEIRELFLN